MDEKLNYQFKFSIIMAVYNVENYLNEAIDSIIDQTIGFEKNVQLILVDDGSVDSSYQISQDYEKKYPSNIIAITKENGGQASARNLGIKYAKGKYLNFLDSDDYISKNTLAEVFKFFEEHEDEIDILAIPMILFERKEGPHRLNNKFEMGNRVIDLNSEPNNPLLSSSSAFIKFSVLKDLSFDENLVNLEDALVINKILLKRKKLGVISTGEYYYRQRFSGNSTVDSASLKKEYFTDRLRDFYMVMIDHCIESEGEIPEFIQYLMSYDLQWLLKIPNLNIFDTEDEIREFWNILNNVLDYIDEDKIIKNENIISDSLQSFFIYLKKNRFNVSFSSDANNCVNNNYHDNPSLVYGNKFSKKKNKTIYCLLNDFLKDTKYTDSQDNKILLKTKDFILDDLNKHRIWLDIVEIKNNQLNVSGLFITNFKEKNISIKVLKETENNIEEYIAKEAKYNTVERSTHKFLGIEWEYLYNFDVSINLRKNEKSALKFIVNYDDGEVSGSFESFLGLNYNVGLSDFSAFIPKKPFIILFKNLKLFILPYRFTSMLRYEFSNARKILKDKPQNYKHTFLVKTIYFLSYPFLKNKKIWIFSDRPNFADDNAKHLFNYASKQNDEFDKYFVVEKTSKSFNEMKEFNKNIVPFGSLKHQILYLFSEKIISSFVNEGFINPFYEYNKELYDGYATADRYFLQHGVTKDDISHFIKKYNNNLSLIVTVSDLERESFLNEGYNYNESIIPVLGFPRYDNLITENDKKQILFMPTWRLQLENEDLFVNSDYYSTLNGFLNNEKLHSLLKKHGYELVFKPHAELMRYIDLIDICDEVYLSLDDSYQDLFNCSSILITDYSSVFFDFAYLKKPVIYYQTGEEYHYEDGYFDYESMGFGDVIQDENILLEKIEDYLENGCLMEEIYKENVDKFFKFNDKKNSQRVYDWILEH